MTEPENHESEAPRRFLTLFTIGFLTILAGVIILVATALIYGDETISSGVIIFIGPIPLVIGTGPNATWLILIAIILVLISLTMLLTMRRGTQRIEWPDVCLSGFLFFPEEHVKEYQR